jgi:ribosome-binding factor A
MNGYRRTARLNELLKRELSRLVRLELKDPRIRTATITGVAASPDLTQATVFVRTLGDDVSAAEAVAGLESASGFLRRKLGKELHLRRIPEFRFVEDRTLDEVGRIDQLLAAVREASEEQGSDDGSSG